MPFESTRDYHRGIVKDISNPHLPVVFYIDFGIVLEVARGCLRKLHQEFVKFPTFYLSGEIENSPLYEGRLRLDKKLKKRENVLLRAEKYDKTKDRYLFLLDTDSGITSDASR